MKHMFIITYQLCAYVVHDTKRCIFIQVHTYYVVTLSD